MRTAWLTLLLTVLPLSLSAQGFNTVDGRNHPHLNWQASESERFVIIYPERISGIESLAAAVAEAVYEQLSANLDVEFEEKIRIYLADVDEINNGFSMVAGEGYAVIWVGLNDYADTWTGREKWLRKVIAHELAHIFHFKATRTNLGLLNYLVADPTPRLWAEGLAQYQTELWDSERGDRWLRTAVFDDRLNYEDGSSIYNPRLLYASGNSQMRYFAERFGDSALSALLSHRKSALLFDYYSSDSAFKDVTDLSYSDFQGEWRKHVNIYYNTIASQMDRIDSLGVKPESLPDDFIFDLTYSSDQSEFAMLSLPSAERPVRRLVLMTNDSLRHERELTHGSVNEDLSWSPVESLLTYSRLNRAENGSLVNDLYLLDTSSGKEIRLTIGRKAVSPVFSPVGDELAYIVNENGTGNIFFMNLDSGQERRLTQYSGDIQLIHLEWNHEANVLIVHRFEESGDRHLVAIDPGTGHSEVLDNGRQDNRLPVSSPDGTMIAYTSLRDDVPNVFITSLDTGREWRVTNLFTGAELLDWIPSDNPDNTGLLVIKATETKRSENIYLLDAGTVRVAADPVVPQVYASWKEHRPPNDLPQIINSDETLITKTDDYNSWQNLTHFSSMGLPFYAGKGNWGMLGYTSWLEPLGKHLFAGGGLISLADPAKSFGNINYINRAYTPSVRLSIYRGNGSAYYYGSNFLVEKFTGVTVSASWPLEIFERPYQNSQMGVKLQVASVLPQSVGSYSSNPSVIRPVSGTKSAVEYWWELKKRVPYEHNLVHPLDGYGLRLSLQAINRELETGATALTADAGAYTILPSVISGHRIYLHGRVQAQTGRAFPQNYIGFSKKDNIGIVPPQSLDFLRLPVEAERVRGYRDFIAGRMMFFASGEYRIPLVPSLDTSVLGLIRFGMTTFTLFADAGAILGEYSFTSRDSSLYRLGLGGEIKNEVQLGPLSLVHSAGVAQRYKDLFGRGGYEFYYRIRAGVPF